jgi:NAD(P)-dependent dehydrogenase (short-subunit alcohol dehydrogenase family)
MNRQLDLSGRVVLVTGAAQGIGAACARSAALAGARVAVADIDVDGARRCADALAAAGCEALAVHVDVSAAASVDAAIERIVAEFGALHAAIHAAGGTDGVAPTALLETTVEGFERVVRLNLLGTFLVCRAVAGHMVAAEPGPSDRSIVLVGSLQGVVGSPHLAPYGASKAGIIHLARTAALELAPYGIRVNVVSPTITDTPSVLAMVDDERRAASEAAIPLRRIGTGDDVAAAALLLLSTQGSFITGQNIVVDGGLSLTTARAVRH